MPNNELLKYASMATQIMATLGVAIFFGLKADRFLQWKFPILTILLPLAALFSLFFKIYKDSSSK